MSIELRSFNFELRADRSEEHGHFINGRPIVFGETYDNGLFTESIAPGALDKTDLRDVRFLVNHNTDMIPLARSRNNNANSTMQMSPDDDGMTIRVDLDTERNAEALSLYSAVERGDISGMSFMFRVDSDKWTDLDSEHPHRTITGIQWLIKPNWMSDSNEIEGAIADQNIFKVIIDPSICVSIKSRLVLLKEIQPNGLEQWQTMVIERVLAVSNQRSLEDQGLRDPQ